MSTPLLTVSEIDDYGDSYVLQGVSFTLRKGQIAAILGRNGMDKMTSIRSVAGLTPPRNGDIIYRDKSLRGQPPYAIAQAGIAHRAAGPPDSSGRSACARTCHVPTSVLARSARASNGGGNATALGPQRGVEAVSAARRANQSSRRVAERRRAAMMGDRPGAHGQSRAHSDGRAIGGLRALCSRRRRS